jgi:hypothetical protein
MGAWQYVRSLVETDAPAKHRVDAALAAIGWAVVYLAVWITGERLATEPLVTQWQLLPLDALADDPIGSVWHLHIQPPLWNLAVGALARWSPASLAVSLQLLLLASGATLAAAVTATLRNLGATRGWAFGLTAVGTLNGGILLAGFRPQYELPVAAMLAGVVWLATVAPGPRSVRTLIGASALVTALVLTRSVYHPVLVVPVLGLLLWHHRARVDRRVILATAAIPVVLVGGWLGKNAVLFDTATMSSWSGMNLLRSVAPALEPEMIEDLHDDGTISGVAVVGPFGGVEDYEDLLPPCEPSSDDPVLTIEERAMPYDPDALVTIPSVANFNHECLLPAYAQASDDALAMAWAEPYRWLLAREWSLSNWFTVPTHPTDSALVDVANRLQNVTLGVVANPFVPASWQDDHFWVTGASISLVLALAAGLLVIAAIRRLKVRTICADRTPMVLGGFLVAWTFVVGVTFELGEQERFRLVTDPIAIALAGLVVLRWRAKLATRRAAAADGAERAPKPAADTQRRTVALAGAVIAVGVLLVNVRDGSPARTVVDQATAIAQVQAVRESAGVTTTETAPVTPSTAVDDPTTTAPAPQATTSSAAPTAAPSTTAPALALAATKPSCSYIAHIGDSNFGMAASRIYAHYEALGLPVLVNSGNGRGATTVTEGTTAVDAIAAVKETTSAEGRCWVLALSNADARQSMLDGTDPITSPRTIAEAVGGEPTLWIAPVMVSATTDWNLTATTAYELALREVASSRSNITVLDWPSIALQHLTEFQADGIHYKNPLYDLYVETITGKSAEIWEVQP